ncbi:MAG TPA: alpha-glucuronidase family glycosyl hydrolase [Terracidiphilus sp.]|nr:alpha-glucuronidase family glycosyl hydrolase [Terracidiphilus sp.]
MKCKHVWHAKKIDFFVRILMGAAIAAGITGHAQTTDLTWLHYAGDHRPTNVPEMVRALGSGMLEQSAVQELKRGIAQLNSGTSKMPAQAANGEVLVGTVAEFHKAYPGLAIPAQLAPHGFWLARTVWHKRILLVVVGANEHGALFGAFDLLRRMATDEDLAHLNVTESPAMPIRWVDQWDNPDGSITRGYGGRSMFFEGGNVRADLTQVGEYARLLASVGINGCDINNVNAAPELLDADHLKQIARIADAMRPWGVRVALSVALVSPEKLGGLKTADPLDRGVKAWWAAKADEIYKLIPDFAGFTVKADSEGEVGPSSYGRSPADAANLLAAALAPHGGVVLYRAFVYNNHLNWRDPKADRARAAYDIFHPLDGKFLPNVIVQTKEGPIDFQAQEPVSPLFAGLRETNQAMELQITQEYLGQQRHLVYIAPMWKQVLDFDLRASGKSTPVKNILEGKSFDRPLGGMVGVACLGQDWLGSPLAMANLYAFGRLAWNPNLTPEEIAREWIKQTLGNDPLVVATVEKMLMQSWPAYVDYTGFLGTQTLTDITGSHYGPNIESSERNGWGQWHFDDSKGIGMDRTVATGTGFVGQYPPEVARIYESLKTTPDYLLLFFHHVPYTYKLHSGDTVIQYVYDSHYKGAQEAAELGKEWATLKGHVDPALFSDVAARLQYQAGHAIVWRDAIVQYFLKQSGIPDDKGRAGHYPGRLEAEDAKLDGYAVIDVRPWEDASRGKAVSCADAKGCSAEWTWKGAAGRFNIAVQYFDLQGGAAKFALSVNGNQMAAWTADALLPSRRPNGDNSTRYTARGVHLKPGDMLRVEGVPDGKDAAALDYVEVTPAPVAGHASQ